MPVKVSPEDIPDVLVIESTLFRDDRGYFTELYNEKVWRECGFPAQEFKQDNLSVSQKGTLRGLHYQILPDGQGKLVRALHGSVFDVAVDIRRGSPTFGQWVGRTLSEENACSLWIPAGFAHGFISLEDDTCVVYKCTESWVPQSERAILYNDPAIGIEWPIKPELVNDKDSAAPLLADAEYNF